MSVDSTNSPEMIDKLRRDWTGAIWEDPVTKEFCFDREPKIFVDQETSWYGRCVAYSCIGFCTLIGPVIGLASLIVNIAAYIVTKALLFYLEHRTSAVSEKERLNILKCKIDTSLTANRICNSAKMLVPLIGPIWALKTQADERDLVGGLVEEYNALLPAVKMREEMC